jgi:hypothetical protein
VTDIVSSQDLALALVDALGPVIPDESRIHLRADGGVVRIIDSAAGGGEVLVDLGTLGTAGRLTTTEAVTAVVAVVSTLQDVVCEALTEPWPRTEDGGLALPDAGVEGGWLVARFGVAADAAGSGLAGGAIPVVPVDAR